MKDWPFGAALRGEASNRLVLRWLKTVVVSDRGKGALEVSGGDQGDERKRIAADVLSFPPEHGHLWCGVSELDLVRCGGSRK